MTTARDIITGAYQRLGLLPLGADLDPDRAAAGLAAYNDMLNAWAADGDFSRRPESSDPANGRFLREWRFHRRELRHHGGGYPPYGPSDSSTPPPGSASGLWSRRRISLSTPVRGRGEGAPRGRACAAKRDRTAALDAKARAEGACGDARLLRDRAARGPGHRPDLDAEPSPIRVSLTKY